MKEKKEKKKEEAVYLLGRLRQRPEYLSTPGHHSTSCNNMQYMTVNMHKALQNVVSTLDYDMAGNKPPYRRFYNWHYRAFVTPPPRQVIFCNLAIATWLQYCHAEWHIIKWRWKEGIWWWEHSAHLSDSLMDLVSMLSRGMKVQGSECYNKWDKGRQFWLPAWIVHKCTKCSIYTI